MNTLASLNYRPPCLDLLRQTVCGFVSRICLKGVKVWLITPCPLRGDRISVPCGTGYVDIPDEHTVVAAEHSFRRVLQETRFARWLVDRRQACLVYPGAEGLGWAVCMLGDGWEDRVWMHPPPLLGRLLEAADAGADPAFSPEAREQPAPAHLAPEILWHVVEFRGRLQRLRAAYARGVAPGGDVYLNFGARLGELSGFAPVRRLLRFADEVAPGDWARLPVPTESVADGRDLWASAIRTAAQFRDAFAELRRSQECPPLPPPVPACSADALPAAVAEFWVRGPRAPFDPVAPLPHDRFLPVPFAAALVATRTRYLEALDMLRRLYFAGVSAATVRVDLPRDAHRLAPLRDLYALSAWIVGADLDSFIYASKEWGRVPVPQRCARATCLRAWDYVLETAREYCEVADDFRQNARSALGPGHALFAEDPLWVGQS